MRFPAIALLTMGLAITGAHAADEPMKDQIALFAEAKGQGRTGIARKTMPVDARPARPGEIVVTLISGEGEETRSKPAEEGDWVVRNRCAETGDEEILVKASKFAARYGEPQSKSDPQGWREFRPKGIEVEYFIVPPALGAFSFNAPWGEPMVAKPGDAIVQTPDDSSDTYRVAAAAFRCTYEIVKPAKL